MALFEAMQRRMRALKLRRMLEDREPGASRLQEIVDLIIMQAYCDEAAGIRKDKVLFSFESTFEEISDRIALIRENGDTETYRDIYSKLYAFADEMMADSYMPMYLFIMYRYANALLETGEAEAAAQMFEKLCAGTERLIGIRNTYGIHCLERVTVAAVMSGQPGKVLKALDEMNEIAVGEFGTSGAVTEAVRRFTGRVKIEIERSV